MKSLMNDEPDVWKASCFSPQRQETVEDLLLELRLPDEYESISATFVGYTRSQGAQLMGMMRDRDLVVQGTKPGDERQRLVLEGVWISSVEGSADDLYFGRRPETHLVVPSALEILHIGSEKGSQTEVAITPTALLDPSSYSFVPGDDGALEGVTILEDRVVRIELQCDGETKTAAFLPTYRWFHHGSKTVRESQLVCQIDNYFVATTQEREALYRQIDDFLLLVGFSTDEDLLCVGCHSTGPNAFESHTRRDRTIKAPKASQNTIAHGTIVDSVNLLDFWRSSFPNYLNSVYQPEIRAVLYSLRASKDTYLEYSFLALFAALEHMLSKFRLESGTGQVLAKEDWDALEGGLRGKIKSQITDASESRKELYGNLAGLNRTSLGTTFSMFKDEVGVDTDDLWPISNVDDLPTIPRVRNLIVHGHAIVRSDVFFDFLVAAELHLRWTLELIILSLLGYPRSESLLSVEALRRQYKPELIDPDALFAKRKELKQAIKS